MRVQRIFGLTYLTSLHLYLTCLYETAEGFWLGMKLTCTAPVLDMFAGIGDAILPADHMVNRPKLTSAHLALNFIL